MTSSGIRSALLDVDYTSQPNWDGEGALKIDRLVIELAAATCERFAHDVLPDEIIPGSDGSLALVWDQSENYVYLDVGPGASLHLYYKSNVGKWEGVGNADNPTLQHQLKQAFRRFSANKPLYLNFGEQVATAMSVVPITRRSVAAANNQFFFTDASGRASDYFQNAA